MRVCVEECMVCVVHKGGDAWATHNQRGQVGGQARLEAILSSHVGNPLGHPKRDALQSSRSAVRSAARRTTHGHNSAIESAAWKAAGTRGPEVKRRHPKRGSLHTNHGPELQRPTDVKPHGTIQAARHAAHDPRSEARKAAEKYGRKAAR